MDVQRWIGCEDTGSLGIQGDLEELEGWGGRGKGGREGMREGREGSVREEKGSGEWKH